MRPDVSILRVPAPPERIGAYNSTATNGPCSCSRSGAPNLFQTSIAICQAAEGKVQDRLFLQNTPEQERALIAVRVDCVKVRIFHFVEKAQDVLAIDDDP